MPDHATPAERLLAVRAQGEMMHLAYARYGGLVSTDVVETLLRSKIDQPISMLAKWLVRRSAISLPWNSQTLLPMFQFDLRGMTLRPEVTSIVAELTCVFDDWELAHWFACANTWLAGKSPLELVFEDPAGVGAAARADRFVVGG